MSHRMNALVGRYRRWRRFRTTVRELQNLTPDELADIGISYADIRRCARQAAIL